MPEEIFLPDDIGSKKGGKSGPQQEPDKRFNKDTDSQSGPLNIDPETIAWERLEE